MSRYGDVDRRYSEQLKLRIVKEVESGKLSQAEASRAYGVNYGTLWSWIQLHGRVKRRKVVEVVMSDEREKIAELQKALAEAHIKARFYEELVKIAKDKHGIDLKKNIGMASPKSSRRKGKASRG